MPLNDLAGVARMAAALPEELQKAQIRGVRAAALYVTTGIRGEIRSASGGDNRLSGVGKRGARVGAKYDVKGTVNPTAIIKAIGPLHFLEHDTSPHEIRPRALRGRGSRKRFTGNRALKFKNGLFAASAQHPGTGAKRPFEKGYLKTRDQAGVLYDKEIQAGIRKVLA
jgi:hypothetical protein